MTLPITPNNPAERPSGSGCLVTTSAALVSFDVEQALADDIKYLANQASRRLSGFSGSGGELVLDWLSQLKAFVNPELPAGTSDGMYCLLHNPASSPCVNADPTTVGGSAVLDGLALRSVQNLCAGGSLDGLTVSPSLDAAFANTLALAPADRFNALTPCQQAELRDDYVDQRLGSMTLAYPSSVPAQTALYGLLEFAVTDVSVDIDIGNTQVITELTVGANDIHFSISLPDVSAQAFLLTAPGPSYWAALGIGAGTCWFFGIGCTLLALVGAVSLLLATDISYVSIDFPSPQLDVHVSLVPDAQQRLVPTATVTLTSTPQVFIAGLLPTLQTVIDPIIDAVNPLANEIRDKIESGLQTAAQELLDDFGWRFPLTEPPVPDEYVQSVASGQASTFLDAISEQSPASAVSSLPGQLVITAEDQLTYRFRELVGSGSFPTTVTGNIGGAQLSFANHLWGGYGFSQNYLNIVLEGFREADRFHLVLSQAQVTDLVAATVAAAPLTKPYFEGLSMQGSLWPDSAPRLLLTPAAVYETGYAVCVFDDLRLCLTSAARKGDPNKEPVRVVEFRLGARVGAEIAFGSVNQATNQLDIATPNTNRPFDFYYDLANISLDPAVQDVATFGIDHLTIVNLAAPGLQTVFGELVSSMLSNDAAWVPREPGDPIHLQRYPISGNWIVCQLWPTRGNLYLLLGCAGPLWTVLPLLAGGFSCDEARTLLALAGT